jgi:hypothetical protein
MERIAVALDSPLGIAGSFVVLFVTIMVALLFGSMFGSRRVARDPDAPTEGFGAFEGAVFGLMGLLIAFTFSGAVDRFDARRDLITRETNAIGTAYLRLSLLPPAAQTHLKHEMRAYVSERLDIYQLLPDVAAAQKASDAAAAMQLQIWKDAVATTSTARSAAVPSLVLQSINDMIDITTERAVALVTHPPGAVFALLALSILASAFLAGHGMGMKRSRSWAHILAFAALTATSLYVIVDIEFPRFGVIRIDAADQILVNLRDSMN